MGRVSALAEDVMSWAEDDYIMVAVVLSVVVEHGIKEPDLARLVAIGVIAELLVSGRLVAGDLREQFVSWDGSPGEWIARIAAEWLSFETPLQTPAIIAWFDLPHRPPLT